MRRKHLYLVAALAALSSLLFAVTSASGNGNGAPSGSHYNLNIVGVEKGKNPPMDGTSRHTIFVPLNGSGASGCKIALTVGAPGEYSVEDGNCFDGDGAEFKLPIADATNSGTTTYSVFARALGTPGGSSDTTTCGYDATGELECSLIKLELDREPGQTQFSNATKYLLYVYADTNEDGTVERVPLFGSALSNYFWQYDNYGLRLAQLRFYECSTTVGEYDTNTGDVSQSDTCGRTGN